MHRERGEVSYVGAGGGAMWRTLFRFFPIGWTCYLVFSQIYVFPPGYPQPSDGVMALMILVLGTGYIIRVPLYRTLYLIAFAFLGYVAIVNWFWWGLYEDPRTMFSSVYYAYNFGVFLVVISAMQEFRKQFITITSVTLLVAIVIQLVVIHLAPMGNGIRAIGTFGNPNQLGYWSLLTLSCYLVLKREQKLQCPDLILIGGTTYLIALSLSKAAMLSFLMLLVAGFVFQGMSRHLKLAGALTASVMALIMVTQPALVDITLSQTHAGEVVERLENIGRQADDSLSARGYDRLWLYPEYLVFGAGEGSFDRFQLDKQGGMEIHSTFATILFSYGLVGFLLFSLMLWYIFREAPLRHLVYFLPLCAYGLSHQGLRFTLLWVFLALVFGLSQSRAPADSLRGGNRARTGAPLA